MPPTTAYKVTATTSKTTTKKPVQKTTTAKTAPAPATTVYNPSGSAHQPPYTDNKGGYGYGGGDGYGDGYGGYPAKDYKDGHKYKYHGDIYKRKHVLESTRYIDMISYMTTYAKYMAVLASEYKYDSKAVATVSDCGSATGSVTFQYDKVNDMTCSGSSGTNCA